MEISRGRFRLLELITAKGWTQTEYANRSGRSQRMISHFCNDTRVMLPEDMYTAVLLLGCKWEDLYEYKVKRA
ncbi:hypothetical protein SAMN05518670_3630 [Paenibacillus sp. OK076]|nr:hypothetical protein SAMN05518670_3630 [Paenibacillus sp. OK076]